MTLKKLLLGSVAGLLFATSALAQCPGVNCTVPSSGIAYINKAKTYSAISVGLVPAASATDIFCINQSTTKTVHVDYINITGTAGTAITTPVILKLNHSQDTSGTAATGLALPVAAPNSSADPAATATLTAYTANPTVPDSTPNYLSAQALSFAVTTSANSGVLPFETSTSVDLFNKGWDMPPAATSVQQLCLNLNGVSISSGVLAITMIWQESP